MIYFQYSYKQAKQTYLSGPILEGIFHLDGQDAAGKVRTPTIPMVTPAGLLPVRLSPLRLA